MLTGLSFQVAASVAKSIEEKRMHITKQVDVCKDFSGSQCLIKLAWLPSGMGYIPCETFRCAGRCPRLLRLPTSST